MKLVGRDNKSNEGVGGVRRVVGRKRQEVVNVPVRDEPGRSLECVRDLEV